MCTLHPALGLGSKTCFLPPSNSNYLAGSYAPYHLSVVLKDRAWCQGGLTLVAEDDLERQISASTSHVLGL